MTVFLTWANPLGSIYNDVYGQRALGAFDTAIPGLHRSLVNAGRPRDANAFYYKSRPAAPVDDFDLECEQWRHGAAERFYCDIYSAASSEETKASLAVKVQAENLVDPFELALSVRVTRTPKDTVAIAKTLIANLR